MPEFTNKPLWVGMDVDAELALYAKEDRRRQRTQAARSVPARRPSGSRSRGSQVSVAALTGKEAHASQSPLVA
jgi:hypothetical protein